MMTKENIFVCAILFSALTIGVAVIAIINFFGKKKEVEFLQKRVWELYDQTQKQERAAAKTWATLLCMFRQILEQVDKKGVTAYPGCVYRPLMKTDSGAYYLGTVNNDIVVGERAALRNQMDPTDPLQDITTSPVVEKLYSPSKEWAIIKTQSGSVYLVGNWVN